MTLYEMLTEKFPDWKERFPSPKSLFFHGASSNLRSLPLEVVAWIAEGDFSTVPGRMHHRYNLIINLNEMCAIRSSGISYILYDNQAMLIFPGQYHHYIRTQNIDSHLRLHFTFLLADANDPSLEPLKNKVFTLNEKQKRILFDILALILHEKECRSPEIPLLMGMVLNELLALSQESFAGADSTNKLFMKAVNYIREHYTEPISVKTVADAVAISPSRLADIFKAQTNGVTIGTYIDRMRFFRSIDFLGTTDMNIAQIAAACGYGNQFSFSRRFKQLIGLSPLAYRKSCLEHHLIRIGLKNQYFLK